jgi:hypothetical protein
MKIFSCGLAVLLLSICVVHAGEHGTKDVAADMTQAASRFLASLSQAEMAKADLKFDDPARRDWHNIPKDQRKGLQVKEMSPEQKKLCHNLLQAGLSKTGYQTVTRIMSLENNLFEGEKNLKGTPLRDPERYFLTIFGKPEATGSWGWSFEGHHLSLNFVVKDGEVVGDTPNFMGANPANVGVFIQGGPAQGVRTLMEEEQFGFDLVNSLDDAQKKKAIIAETAPNDYRNAGKPEPPISAPEGISVSELTDAQKKTLRTLLEEYNINMTDAVAAARMSEIDAQGFDKLYFAWAGATKPGIGHYYRVQGPTFVLEFCNIQKDPQGNNANHIHSVWRSLKHDFGVAVK